MAKLFLWCFIFICSITLTCINAATYMVGDNAGWDISSDLGSWAANKSFKVGDNLTFQYSSSHSMNEVTQESFENCNTTNILKAYSNGNTTITLSKPGETYFICGNKLHCLGGMKLQVNVEGDKASSSPIGQPVGTNLPQPERKNPQTTFPTSNGFKVYHVKGFLGFVIAIWLMV